MVSAKTKSKKTGARRAGKNYKIVILEDRCKGCKLCVSFCPSDTLEMSEKTNVKGYFLPMVVDITTCKGCNLCSKYCPDFAIYCEEDSSSK
jgi:2-oxoglutarate ferredoxin oxidoreductase subunit delta